MPRLNAEQRGVRRGEASLVVSAHPGGEVQNMQEQRGCEDVGRTKLEGRDPQSRLSSGY
jgi:hypothetical protein